MRRRQFTLKTILGRRRPTKRGYIGGFLWAFLGDTGDDGMSWEPIVGFLLAGVIGWLADKAISPHAFTLMGQLLGMLLGGVIAAIRVADQPRPTGADQSATPE